MCCSILTTLPQKPMAGAFGENVHGVCKRQIGYYLDNIFERLGHILKEALIISDGVTNVGLLLLGRKTMI